MDKEKGLSRIFGGKKKVILVCIAALAVAAIIIINNLNKALEVEVYTVNPGSVNDTYKERAVISLGDKYHILSKVSGNILEVLADENSPVKKGDVLVRIDNRDLLYQKSLRQSSLDSYIAKKEESDISKLMATSPMEYINGLNASLESARAAYALAQTDYDAKQALFNTQSVSLIELETSKANYESAKANFETANNRYNESNNYLDNLKSQGLSERDISEKFYESTKNQLEAAIDSERTAIGQLDKQIEDCEVKCEYDGVVSSIPAKNISMAAVGGELAVIDTDNNEYRIECSVLTDVVPYINVGDAFNAEFNLRGIKKSYTGKVSEIYNFATEEKSPLGLKEYRVKVVGILDNSDDVLKNGYGVDAVFTLYKNDDVISVPIGAVFTEDDKDYVFKIEGGRAVKTPVNISYKSSVEAVIDEGLKENDKVILNADEDSLDEGSKVKEKK